MLHITFERARKARACSERYKFLAKKLGGIRKYGKNTQIPLDKVLEICGLYDTLWALRCVIEPVDKEIRLFACDCAERVLPIFEKYYPNNNRIRKVIEVSREYAYGRATIKELIAARAAAWAATSAAASAAAWAAASAAAWAAASAATSDAASDAEREWQKNRLLKMIQSIQKPKA